MVQPKQVPKFEFMTSQPGGMTIFSTFMLKYDFWLIAHILSLGSTQLLYQTK